MTHHTALNPGFPAAGGDRLGLEDLDLSPQGLADAPANQQDPDSLGYAGNSGNFVRGTVSPLGKPCPLSLLSGTADAGRPAHALRAGTVLRHPATAP
jgi:hypothetical protein